MTDNDYDQPSKYMRGMSSLAKLRVEAAAKTNALEYTTYCMATGIDPEEQYMDLYNQGMEERKKHPDLTSKLEFIIDNILTGNKSAKENVSPKEEHVEDYVSADSLSKDEYNKNFLKKARTYSSNINEGIDKKIKLLQIYPKFRKGGSNDLTKYLHMELSDELKAKIGRQFNHIVENYENKYHGKAYQKNK